MRNVKSEKEEREVKREVQVMRLLAEKCNHPNGAFIFDRRLLHTGSPNYSTEHERLLVKFC